MINRGYFGVYFYGFPPISRGYFGVHFYDFSPISSLHFPDFNSFLLSFGLQSSGFDDREFNLRYSFLCTSFGQFLHIFRC